MKCNNNFIIKEEDIVNVNKDIIIWNTEILESEQSEKYVLVLQ